MTIGEKLKEARKGKSSIEVAKAVGITRSALMNYESNIRIPRDETKKKLADYFGVTVDELFY